ncbi:MAG TPA: exodeoxyribonuclease III, partial [Casimicrobiaceae bacterium]|nr:exodeoxyribonuclease III [Casimicrobiaceae bacterium]
GDVPRSLAAPRQSHATFHPARRKGYSGVAVYAKHAPQIATGFGHAEFDAEGRYLQADFADLSIVSLYLPSGSSGPHRQASKFRFLDAFLPHLESLVARGREVILCGDWNIAHQPIDLRNWRANQKNSGFLPEERAWLSRVFDELRFVDVFRRVDARADQYTWWSNRGEAWKKNVGWRIDYQIATPGIAATARAAAIYKNRRFSDHAPLIIDYDYVLR